MPDLADTIFDAPLPAGFGSGGAADVVDTPEEPEQQDVDLEGQGKDEHQPATPGEEDAKEKETDEGKEPEKPEGEEKGKRQGAKEAREWGERWKKSHDELETKFKEAEPILKSVEEKFGGEANLEFAAEIYNAVRDEENFDPEVAWDFLSENIPVVAEKMVQHVAQEIVEKATSTAIQRTFGRPLSEDEVKEVNAFLAAGKPTDRKEFSKFLQGTDIPDSLKYDAEGNEIPTATLDYMRRQQALLNQTNERLQGLEGRLNGAETEQQEAIASEAVEKYVGENFKAIDDKLAELGLDKALEGETVEIKAFREQVAAAYQAVALSIIGRDETFQAMYNNALSAVAKSAISKGKNKIAAANAVDFSRRIRAKISSHAATAAELMSPLIDAFAAKRGTQVEKATKGAKQTPKDSPGFEKPKAPTKVDPNVDPFDDVSDVVADMRRRGELRTI